MGPAEPAADAVLAPTAPHGVDAGEWDALVERGRVSGGGPRRGRDARVPRCRADGRRARRHPGRDDRFRDRHRRGRRHVVDDDTPSAIRREVIVETRWRRRRRAAAQSPADPADEADHAEGRGRHRRPGADVPARDRPGRPADRRRRAPPGPAHRGGQARRGTDRHRRRLRAAVRGCRGAHADARR